MRDLREYRVIGTKDGSKVIVATCGWSRVDTNRRILENHGYAVRVEKRQEVMR